MVINGNHMFTKGYPGFKILEKNFIPCSACITLMLFWNTLQLRNMYDENFPISADKDFKLKTFKKC